MIPGDPTAYVVRTELLPLLPGKWKPQRAQMRMPGDALARHEGHDAMAFDFTEGLLRKYQKIYSKRAVITNWKALQLILHESMKLLSKLLKENLENQARL
ncbi:hypothetical protein PsorP6_007089 [Peronosclerospora sorghi]|uniref:Uncharacterized protein n=1 Tax=Peronosclerospora sorghi TaxID=230839 RepID=A0ACC0W8P3_9STRA|nr:hypothetical protein PsorP6_007089 [Peronosclerospora sorghi]